MTNIDQMTLIFRALAHPARLLILETLRSGQDSIKELSKPFEMSKPAITRHLKILEQAGLISRSRKAKSQPAKLEL
ncbi:MAG TPA: metalloregulator ArsR/SmtB family transcription factor, partial [Candidatus Hodarchaeales archaeon]|nr:metalloregulator ArsR/SmtB family transcription factor [Candidatus Hodarchaeales archaeon]